MAGAPPTPTDPQATKPWQSSLTVKGAALAAAAPFIATQGPTLLHFLPMLTAADDQTLCLCVSQILAGVGGIMAFIGRFRVGGLH